MFGRPVEANRTSRGPVAPARDEDSEQGPGQRPQKPIPSPLMGWGNQANFDLAGPPGRLQALIADLWTRWWRPWALLGILFVVLAVVVSLK
jgi:hypothetical protein